MVGIIIIIIIISINIHDKLPRFLNSWPIAIYLHDVSSTSILAVPKPWNGQREVVTQVYPVLVLLVLNHPSVLLYILSFVGILLQLLFTSASPTIDIP